MTPTSTPTNLMTAPSTRLRPIDKPCVRHEPGSRFDPYVELNRGRGSNIPNATRLLLGDDVHVVFEKVGGIESCLQRLQPRQVRAVGGRGAVGDIVFEVVHVPCRRE